MGNDSREDFRNIIPIVLLGTILRIIHYIYFRRSILFSTPVLDELYHHLWAQRVAGGSILPHAPFFRAPLYPYFLGGLYSIFGTNVVVAYVLNSMLGLGVIYITYKLAHALFKSNRVAITAGVLVAVYPVFIFFESFIFLDTMAMFLNLLGLFFLYRCLRVRRPCFIVLSGLFLGLSAITRPNILIAIPFLAIWLFHFVKASRVKYVGCFLAPIFLIVLPITLNNIITDGDFLLISTQGGVNFYIGNNDDADGATAIVPEFGGKWEYTDCVWAVKEALGADDVSAAEVSRYYFDKGFDFLINQPLDALKLFIRKAYLLVNNFEISNNVDIYFVRGLSPVLMLPLGFWLIFSLGLVGAVFSFRSKGSFLLLAYLVPYALGVVIFFVTSRFRLPLLPIFIIFSAVAIDRIVHFVRTRDYRRCLIVLLVLVIGVSLSLSKFHNMGAPQLAESLYMVGNIYIRNGDFSNAGDYFKRAIESGEGMSSAHLNLGVVEFNDGNCDRAGDEFKRAIETNPTNTSAYSNLGVIYRLKGLRDSALYYGRKAIDIKPNFVDGYINYAQSLSFFDENIKALKYVEEGLLVDSDNLRLLLAGGKVAERLGELSAACRYYEGAIRASDSDFISNYDIGSIFEEESGLVSSGSRLRAIAYYNLGTILARRGDIESAYSHFLSAIELRPDFADAYHQLGVALNYSGDYEVALEYFFTAESLGMWSAELFFNIGNTYIKLDKFSDAESYYQRALEVVPDFAPAVQSLRVLRQLDSSEKSLD